MSLQRMLPGLFLGLTVTLQAQESRPAVDLSDFGTLDKAIAARLETSVPTPRVAPGYLGISVNKQGTKLVLDVLPGSPASNTGVKRGDVLLQVDDRAVATADAVRQLLQSKHPGEMVR